jgi:hypothetical protein
MIWPLSIIIRGLTSHDSQEIAACLKQLQHSHAGTGFMHESFHKDDVSNYTRQMVRLGEYPVRGIRVEDLPGEPCGAVVAGRRGPDQLTVTR